MFSMLLAPFKSTNYFSAFISSASEFVMRSSVSSICADVELSMWICDGASFLPGCFIRVPSVYDSVRILVSAMADYAVLLSLFWLSWFVFDSFFPFSPLRDAICLLREVLIERELSLSSLQFKACSISLESCSLSPVLSAWPLPMSTSISLCRRVTLSSCYSWCTRPSYNSLSVSTLNLAISVDFDKSHSPTPWLLFFGDSGFTTLLSNWNCSYLQFNICYPLTIYPLFLSVLSRLRSIYWSKFSGIRLGPSSSILELFTVDWFDLTARKSFLWSLTCSVCALWRRSCPSLSSIVLRSIMLPSCWSSGRKVRRFRRSAFWSYNGILGKSRYWWVSSCY